MGLEEPVHVMVVVGKSLDDLAFGLKIFRDDEETDESLRDRIMERLRGVERNRAVYRFEVFINTDFPELSRETPHF